MSDAEKTPDKRLFVMRARSSGVNYVLGRAVSADEFVLIGGSWRRRGGIRTGLFYVNRHTMEVLRRDLALKPGEGPVEVKAWPEVPSEECFSNARTAARVLVTLGERCEHEHLDMDHDKFYGLCEALVRVVDFAMSFHQEPK